MTPASRRPAAVSRAIGRHRESARRADGYHLGAVEPADVADALRAPLHATGHTMTEPALAGATVGTGGPFLIELVGFWTFKLAENTATADGTVINHAVASAGTHAARRRLG